MSTFQSQPQEFDAITDLKNVSVQPRDNDLFLIVDDAQRLLYNYEPNSTLPDDGLNVLELNNFSGRMLLLNPINSNTGGSNGVIMVDQSFLAKFGVTGDSNQPNLILTLNQQRLDNVFDVNNNIVTLNENMDYVNINAMAYMQRNQSSAYQRISPELELLKNGVVVARSSTGYQRHVTNHDASSNTISYTDHDPQQNDVYSLRAQQGSGQNDVLDIDLGHFDLIAVKKLKFYSKK